jgi:hypothetical protein
MNIFFLVSISCCFSWHKPLYKCILISQDCCNKVQGWKQQKLFQFWKLKAQCQGVHWVGSSWKLRGRVISHFEEVADNSWGSLVCQGSTQSPTRHMVLSWVPMSKFSSSCKDIILRLWPTNSTLINSYLSLTIYAKTLISR